MYTGFWKENHKARDNQEELEVRGYNIKIYLREIRWYIMDWINLD
jgi:hypothetical protein